MSTSGLIFFGSSRPQPQPPLPIPLLPEDLELDAPVLRLLEDQLLEVRERFPNRAQDPEGFALALRISQRAALAIWYSYDPEDPYYAAPGA